LRLFDTLYAVSPLVAFAYVVALVVILVVLLWHIIYTFRAALRGRVEDRRYGGHQGRELQPAELEDRARHAAERQDYIAAVRYLFQACLLRLEQAEKRTLRKGATNHEYLRRFQGTPAYEPLHRFVDIIDCKWYGGGRCELSDFDECRRAHAEILLRQGT
jgi:biopolymer transport protein ExbB/TolQ